MIISTRSEFRSLETTRSMNANPTSAAIAPIGERRNERYCSIVGNGQFGTGVFGARPAKGNAAERRLGVNSSGP
jgi:hypothetical protein